MRMIVPFLLVLLFTGCSTTSGGHMPAGGSLVHNPPLPPDYEHGNLSADFPAEALQPRSVVRPDEAPSALKEGRGKHVELTYDGHPSGASQEVRATARKTYLYAQIATNAYDESDRFNLVGVDGPFGPQSWWTGIRARYFKVTGADGTKTCVVAFRGTDFFKVNDWIFGNVLNTQYKQGLAYFDKLRSGNECKDQAGRDQPIVVAGHSLGGAIATYISLRRELAPAFLFNTSPRLTRGSAIVNEREAVAQYSEILAMFRHVFVLAGGTYTTINCIDGNPVGRHSIRPLAACLTAIAASDVATTNPNDPAIVSAKTNGITYGGQILRGKVRQADVPRPDQR